jgi:hypothetical protein
MKVRVSMKVRIPKEAADNSWNRSQANLDGKYHIQSNRPVAFEQQQR